MPALQQQHPRCCCSSSTLPLQLQRRSRIRARATAAAAAPAAAPSMDWRRVQGVLFDIDGTLTDSDPLHFATYQEMLLELGFQGGRPIDEQFYSAHVSGRHNPEVAAALFPGWSSEQCAAFSLDQDRRFRDMAGSRLQAMPGLSEFMAWCDARGVPYAAVTNASRDVAQVMLSALGLSARFKAVVVGEECERAKPFPDPYLAGLQALGLQAQQVVVFEDSPAGLRAAAAAGIPSAIGFTTGHAAEALLAAGACATATDFRDVMRWVHGAVDDDAGADDDGAADGAAVDARQPLVSAAGRL